MSRAPMRRGIVCSTSGFHRPYPFWAPRNKLLATEHGRRGEASGKKEQERERGCVGGTPRSGAMVMVAVEASRERAGGKSVAPSSARPGERRQVRRFPRTCG
ncbi:hypothetical protein KM043_017425 [Ampulex compressa]|nr:hypothetical protein KM043_017425 [Ampulex compressa]